MLQHCLHVESDPSAPSAEEEDALGAHKVPGKLCTFRCTCIAGTPAEKLECF